jgi:hypothetical protein
MAPQDTPQTDGDITVDQTAADETFCGSIDLVCLTK